MTRSEARLRLVERQRRYAWTLARDEYARSAAALVAGKTHDLLNLVQVVQLATPLLAQACTDELRVIVDDIARVTNDAHAQLNALMAVARPKRASQPPGVRGLALTPAVGPVVASVLAELASAYEVGVDYAIDADTRTALDAAALGHLVIGLVLDAADQAWIALTVQERAIEGAPWIEIVRATREVGDGDRFDLRLVEALATRAGGELVERPLPEGGLELVVTLPVVG